MPTYLLALDQGTTSTRAILFRDDLSVVAIDQREFPQIFPRSGWVEHDPEDLWSTSVSVVTGVIAKAGVGGADIAAIGITNQRETTVIWDRATGKAIHNAIVWQDRRTAQRCATLRARGARGGGRGQDRAGPRPYFSATKIAGILDTVPGARARATRGELAFGTVDSFLLWRLTGGKVHATDATNASRTLLLRHPDGRLRSRSSSTCSMCRPRCFPRSAIPPAISARPSRPSSAGRSGLPELPATSRRRPSARPASGRAWSSRPTAPARSRSSIPDRRRSHRRTGC